MKNSQNTNPPLRSPSVTVVIYVASTAYSVWYNQPFGSLDRRNISQQATLLAPRTEDVGTINHSFAKPRNVINSFSFRLPAGYRAIGCPPNLRTFCLESTEPQQLFQQLLFTKQVNPTLRLQLPMQLEYWSQCCSSSSQELRLHTIPSPWNPKSGFSGHFQSKARVLDGVDKTIHFLKRIW